MDGVNNTQDKFRWDLSSFETWIRFTIRYSGLMSNKDNQEEVHILINEDDGLRF